jgi:hypothetical protein
MPDFIHVTPERLMVDSLRLGARLYDTGFRPKHALSIWRGGTAVGVYVDAFFRHRGLTINHTTIATESYSGIGRQGEVIVKGLEHVIGTVCREDGLLLLDDVYESGNTVKAIIETLRRQARANAPEQIMVGTIHRKPDKVACHGVDVCCLEDIAADQWIDYPHELADLITEDPLDPFIRDKDPEVWDIVRQNQFPVMEVAEGRPFHYITAREMLLDSFKLGINVFHDREFQPNFIVALWPGGVSCGLPLHEAYKYKMAKSADKRPKPDHISINTIPGRMSYATEVIGLDYLADRINSTDNVLLVDTTFKSGRLINDALIKLKEVLRRNIDLRRVRVACLYWNPLDDATWTVQPTFRRPHYYIKKIDCPLVYPHAFHRLAYPYHELQSYSPEAADILLGR